MNTLVCRRCDDPAGDDRDARGLCYFCACDVDGHVCWTDDTSCHWCGVPSWHCAGCHKRITDPLDLIACNDDGNTYDLCGACYEAPAWPVPS